MRSIVVQTSNAASGAVYSNWVPMDTFKNPFLASVAVVVSGTVDYDVEHTFDDVLAGVTPTAFTNVDIDGSTGNEETVYDFPVKAVRLKQNSGSGSCVMTIVQAG